MACSDEIHPECPNNIQDLVWCSPSPGGTTGGGGGDVTVEVPPPVIVLPDACCVECNGEIVQAYATTEGWAIIGVDGLTFVDCDVTVLDPCDERCAPKSCQSGCLNCDCSDSDIQWMVGQYVGA